MAKFKFDPIDAEEEKKDAHKEARKEAEKTGEPVRVKGVGTADTPRVAGEFAKEEVDDTPAKSPKQGPRADATTVTLTTLHRQLDNLFDHVKAIEMLLAAQWPKKMEPVKAAEPFPKTTNGGHPIASSGMVAPWKESPSGDQLLLAAKAFVEKKGKKAYRELLAQYEAVQLADVEGEDQQADLMEKLSSV